LYFISDIPGGFGSIDIYKSELVVDQWSIPQNLGRSINTVGNEIFPFIFQDGRLFFSSDAHSILGGLDVYVINAEVDN
jgi:hypothetical protein